MMTKNIPQPNIFKDSQRAKTIQEESLTHINPDESPSQRPISTFFTPFANPPPPLSTPLHPFARAIGPNISVYIVGNYYRLYHLRGILIRVQQTIWNTQKKLQPM